MNKLTLTKHEVVNAVIYSDSRKDGYRNSFKHHQGFTLIEVMISVFIVGILAAIAVPSYREYAITNAERDAQAKMMNLQIELERWRSKYLTYKDFVPKNIKSDGSVDYGYADKGSSNTIINIPRNSGDDYTYRITLVDGDTTSGVKSLVSDETVDNVTGRTWKMVAVPNPKKYIKYGHQMMLTSQGTRCMTKTNKLTAESKDCGKNAKVW